MQQRIDNRNADYIPFEDKALLSVKEMCVYLSIGQTKCRELLADPANGFTVRIGNRLYAHRKNLDNWCRLVRRHKQSMVSIHRLQMPASDSYKGDAVYSQGVLRVDVECPGRVCEIKAHDGEVILIRGGNESERSMVLQRLFQVCIDCLSEVSCKYVSGQPVLMNDSVVNNICFGEPYSEECMNRVLAETDLEPDIAGFEDGIRKKVGKHGTAVSGGQRKRISIARALYGGADVLFLDGLAEAVDRRTEEILISNILEQTEKIIFVASDSVSMLEKATQVVNV